MLAVAELPDDMVGMVITAEPLVVATCTPDVLVLVLVDVDVVVDDEDEEVQLLHVTVVENAFELSPTWKLIVADDAVPPIVTVHESDVDEPAAMVVAELEVGLPLHVNPLGHVKA